MNSDKGVIYQTISNLQAINFLLMKIKIILFINGNPKYNIKNWS